MKNFRKTNKSNMPKNSNPFLPDENDLPDFLLHPTSDKAAKTKLKQANIKGFIDISNTKLESMPEEIFKQNVPIDRVNWWLNVDLTKIDASNNNLSEKAFDDGVHDFRYIPYVKILSLANNKFNKIPMSIYYLQNLIFFDMSGNMITNLDENLLGNLSRLINLNFSNNKIQHIPSSIMNIINLQELNLDKNELQNIPNELINLKYLKKLNLGWNKLQIIQPNFFNNFFSLEELYCNNNIISNVQYSNNYSAFDSIPNLKILDLSYNQLQTFSFFNSNPNLEKLNLSNNKLQYISGMSLCPKLFQIDCSNNNFKQFPNDFLFMNSLRSLNLKDNELNALPSLIYLMDNLAELNIKGNPLRQLPNLKNANIQQIKQCLQSKISDEDIQNMPENLKYIYIKKKQLNNNNIKTNNINRNSPIYNYIKNDSELVITNCDLIEIPFNKIQQNIPENYLTSINLSGNQIENGLENFNYILPLLNRLKTINLSKNNIKYFPLVILNIPTLEELYLSRNLLHNFPSEPINQNNISYISQSLTLLELSNNKIELFPIILGFFKNLKILNLTCNNIKDISCISNMRFEKLEKFLIDDNHISFIPENILFKVMPNVETFTISNNNLRDIPTDLFLLVFLENINFYGNYIKKIHNEYLLNAYNLKSYLKKFHVYTDEQKYFELEQEEKLRQRKIEKENKRLSKISPNYNSSNIENYFNSNFNENNFHKRKIVNDIFGTSNNNNNFNNNNIYNKNKNKKNKNNNDNINNNVNINEQFNLNKPKRSLDIINQEISEVESQMQSPGIQPHIKANLKKKFISLIRERANLDK